MNPFITGLIMGFVRWALQGVFTWMIARSIMVDGQQEEAVKWVAGSVLTLGWIFWVKYRDRLKQLTGQAAKAHITEQQVEAKVADGQAPPVMLPKDEPPSLEYPDHKG